MLTTSKDSNWHLKKKDAEFVLKISSPGFEIAELHLQNDVMIHLAKKNLLFSTPVPLLLPDRSGYVAKATLNKASGASVTYDVRLLIFLKGIPLDSWLFYPEPALTQLGQICAHMFLSLKDFDDRAGTARSRVLYWDLRNAPELVSKLSVDIHNVETREYVVETFNRAWQEIQALDKDLPRGVIHSDLGGNNLIAERRPDGWPDVVGVIDFGDVCHSWLVAELAVCIAHALPRFQAPLVAACTVAKAYHQVRPLTEPELRALWPMVVARTCQVFTSATSMSVHTPQNEYNNAELEEDWRLFSVIAPVPLELAYEAFRAALGLGPGQAVQDAQAWLTSHRSSIRPMIGDLTRITPLDLTTTSPMLHDGAFRSPSLLAKRISEVAESVGPSVTVGRYGEVRLTYARPDTPAQDSATLYLGVDVFVPEGTPVYAPCAGEVILREQASVTLQIAPQLWLVVSGVHSSITGHVQAGSALGTVLNTDFSLPYCSVHLKIIDPADSLPSQFIGIPELTAAWLRVCPNPAALLGLEPAQVAAPLAAPEQSRERRLIAVAGMQEHYYRAPPQIERGWRQHMYDTEGRAYLDMVNNVAVLGHSHPRLAALLSNQARLLNTNSRFLYDSLSSFAEAIAKTFPPELGLNQVFFVNSGSEATDLAMRIARKASGRRDVICLEGAYHGCTTAADEVTTTLNDNPENISSRPPWIHLAPLPNLYRGKYTHSHPDAVDRYVRDLAEVVRQVQQTGTEPTRAGVKRGPAAFIAEPLSGNAGGVELPAGYLARAYEAVRAAGGYCIADEVQVGYGRLGTHFWGFLEHGVRPDLVTMAKACGNGYPLGFVVTTKALATAFSAGGAHFFSSAGGATMAAAAGLTVLQTIQEEKLQENAKEVGAYLQDRLKALQAKHPHIIGYLHGHGFYQGVELVRNAATREPATLETKLINERLLQLGVVSHGTGDYSNVLKVKPPLVFTKVSADHFVDMLDLVLEEGNWCDRPKVAAKL